MTIADLRDYAEGMREDWEYEHHGQDCPLDVDRWLRDAKQSKADADELLFEASVECRINRHA